MRRCGKLWDINDTRELGRRSALVALPRVVQNQYLWVSFPYLRTKTGENEVWIREDTHRYGFRPSRGNATSAGRCSRTWPSYSSYQLPHRRRGHCVVAGAVRASHGRYWLRRAIPPARDLYSRDFHHCSYPSTRDNTTYHIAHHNNKDPAVMLRPSIFGICGILGILELCLTKNSIKIPQDTENPKNRLPYHHRLIFVVMVGYRVCGVVGIQ